MAPPAARVTFARAALILAAIVAAVYARQLFLGQTCALGDHLVFTLPARAHLHEALAAGRIPEWWDAISLGVPYAANPHYSVAYPPAWILAVLPPAWGADFLLILHVWWMALGAYAFARRLGAGEGGAILSGVVLALGGYASGVFGNGIPILTMAWTPWVAWAAAGLGQSRSGDGDGGGDGSGPDPAPRLPGSPAPRSPVTGHRAIFPCIAVIAAQILSGDPAGMVTSLLLAFFVALILSPHRMRAVLQLAAAYLAAAACAAVSLVPALLFVTQTERSGGLDLSVAGVWSMHPLNLLAFVWPDALGDPTEPARDLARIVADSSRGLAQGTSWALDHHIGAIVLVLTIVAVATSAARRRDLALAGCALFFIVLALGIYTPIYGAYRAIFPLERLLRFPEKHIVGALVIISALAGVGFTRISASPGARRVALRVSAGALLLLLAGLAAFALLSARLAPVFAERAAAAHRFIDVDAALASISTGGRLAVAFTALFTLALVLHARWPRIGASAAFCAILAATATRALALQALVDRDYVAAPPEVLASALAAHPANGAPRPRLYRPPTSRLPPGLTRLERVVVSHETAQEDIAAGFGLNDVPGADAAYDRRYADFLAHPPPGTTTAQLLELFGVAWALVPDDQVAATPGTVRARSPYGFSLVEVAPAFPPAFTTDHVSAAPDSRPEGGAPCAIAQPTPEQIDLTCTTAAAAHAVALQAWAPGWSATVDGAPAELERANVLFLAAPIPPGEHHVAFRYRTPGLRLGFAISLAAAVALLLLRRLATR